VRLLCGDDKTPEAKRIARHFGCERRGEKRRHTVFLTIAIANLMGSA
jgi:hypothetical protein